MKHLIALSLLLSILSIHATEITRASILQTDIVPYLQAEDTNNQVQSTQEILAETTSILESTQEELTSANSTIDEATDFINDPAIPDASSIDAMIAELFNEQSTTIDSPSTDSLVQRITNALNPYLDSALNNLNEWTSIKQITGTSFSFILLTNDGTIYGCGSNNTGALGTGYTNQRQLTLTLMDLSPLDSEPLFVTAGGPTFILTKSGTLYGCGTNGHGQLAIGEPTVFKSTLTAVDMTPLDGAVHKVFSAPYNTYVITTNGSIYGCGRNWNGQLGIGSYTTTDTRSTLTRMLPPTDGWDGIPNDIVASNDHVIILTTNGTLYGCGNNTTGQLGIGTRIAPWTTITTPTRMLPPSDGWLGTPQSIAASGPSTLVLTDNGAVYYCGYNLYGQAGINTKTTPWNYITTLTRMLLTPDGLNGHITSLALTSNGVNSLVLTDKGAIYGCGRNSSGELGIGNKVEKLTLTAMLLPTQEGYTLPVAILGASDNSYVLMKSGAVYGCGRNTNGQLGLGWYNTAPTFFIPTLTAMLNIETLPPLIKITD